MSIEDLGKQLVKDGRARRDQMRRRQERYERRAGIARIAVPIAGRIIEDNLQQKAQDFFNSENVLNLKRQHTKAVREANSIFATRDAIAASTKSPEEYFYDQVYDTVQSEMVDAAKLREQEDGINIVGPHIARGGILNQELIGSIKSAATDLSNTRATEYRESLGAAESVVSGEQFDSMMVNKLKDATPQNIVDSVGRKISTIFGGTSTEERQQMALNDIRNHHFSESAAALSAFNKEYESSRSIRDALEYGEMAKEIDEYVPRRIDTEEDIRIINRPDGSVELMTLKRDINEDGTKGEFTIASSSTGIPGLGPQMSPAEKRAEINSARAGFNVHIDGGRMVGAKVFAEEFLDTLEATREDGSKILPSNANTLQEYNMVLAEWNNWIAKNTDKIIDPDMKAQEREWLLIGRRMAQESLPLAQLRDELERMGIDEYIGVPEYREVSEYIERIGLNPQLVSELEKPRYFDDFSDIAEKAFDYKIMYDGFINFGRFRLETLGQ